MTAEKAQWLDGLRAQYRRDPVAAILRARIEHDLLDAEIITALGFEAQYLKDQAYAARIRENCMSLIGARPEVSQDPLASMEAEFASTMAWIALSSGDPEIAPSLKKKALQILTKGIDPSEGLALVSEAAKQRFASQGLASLQAFIGPYAQMFYPTLIEPLLHRFAALGVARKELLELAGVKAQAGEPEETGPMAEEPSEIRDIRRCQALIDCMAQPQFTAADDPELISHYKNGEGTIAQLLGLTREEAYSIAQAAYELFEEGRAAEAVDVVAALTIANPAEAYFHGLLGSFLQKSDRAEEAMASYRKCLELEPTDIQALVNQGELLLTCGRFEEAVTHLQKAVELDPAGENPAVNRARALARATAEVMRAVLKGR